MLLRYDALSSIINGTAQIPKDMTEDDEITTMLEGMKRWDFFFPLRLCQSVALVLSQSFFLCSCREERDEEKGGKASGSCKRGGHLHSV